MLLGTCGNAGILGPILHLLLFALLNLTPFLSVLINQIIGLTSQDSAPAAMLVLSDLREFGCWGCGRLCPEPPTLYFVEVGRPGMAIKKEEARRAVLSAYDSWAKKHPSQASMMGGFLFFRYLQTDRSELLDFRTVGNKWPIVHGWLRDRLKG